MTVLCIPTPTSMIELSFSSHPKVCDIHSKVERLFLVGCVRITYSLIEPTFNWT